MRAHLAVPLAFVAVVAALVAAAPGCGKSNLAAAYTPYNAKAEALLEREIPMWKKIATLLNAQSQDEFADFDGFVQTVRAEGIPFYDAFRKDVDALQAGDPGLQAADAEFKAFAKSRHEFVHLIDGSLDVLRRNSTTQDRDIKDAALRSAMEAYGNTLKGPTDLPDNRFSELIVLATDFQHMCIEPLGEGKITAAEAKQKVEGRILPKLKELRASKFAEDEPSRQLREALARGQEFFESVVNDLPNMEAGARLRRDVSKLVDEGDAHFKKFREELDAVRRKM